MRYYIADCHFFHRSLLTKMDQRGFESAEEMNEYMIERWNQKVKRNDEVVILGIFRGETESRRMNCSNG
ncbi:hypothetical protein [Allobaculum sp. Allo2]|uniref:hypothetical protein n=1 Tax=Allobaculum sp. Allo2 TaxID=2853432 RepID=UPI001F621E45|nr:hypothetical protein [Allobaculum sp. Allo2]